MNGHVLGEGCVDLAPSQIRPWWYTRLGDDPFAPVLELEVRPAHVDPDVRPLPVVLAQGSPSLLMAQARL